MIPEDWPRLRDALERARELPASERGGWLDRELGSGAERAFVERLLAAEEVDDEFLVAPSVAPGSAGSGEVPSWVGVRIASFEIREWIASGGMAAVYEAEQDSPRRRVAFKVMHAGAASPATLRRFRHEAELLARLKHPGIAQVYEAGVHRREHEGRRSEIPWFALELVDGARTITAYAEQEDLSLRRRIELFLTVCDAVQHGHQRGIVHRDLKPGNILVDRTGRPKVIDFGIAKVTGGEGGATVDGERTVQGEIVGTLLYMSPEQIRGRVEEVDTRSDIYALGVVLYELVCGARPFDIAGCSLTEAGRRLLDTDPVVPSRRAAGLPRDLDWIVARAMAKELDQRYRSVAELADDLRRLLRHEAVSAGPPSAGYHVRKFVRRHRALVAAAGLVLLAVVGGLIGTTLGLVRAVRAERRADAERATALGEAAKATAVVDFLVDVLSAPDPSLDGRDVRVMDVLSRAAAEYGERFADQPDVRLRLARALGTVYRGLGLRGESGEELRRALELVRALHAGPHPETALVLGNLGVVCLDDGDLDQAEAYLTESFEMHRRLGTEDARLFHAHVRLGRLRLAQERRGEARELLRSGVEGLERTLAPDARDTLIAKNVLAGVLHQSLELEEAEALYREAFEGLGKALGEEHPDTVRARFNLAMLEHSRGESAGAIEEVRRILELRRGTLGPDHPDTMMTLMNLGGMLQLASRHEEAAALYADSYAGIEERLPSGHPILQTLRVNMGQLERALGRREAAEALLLEVYEERLASHGPHNEASLRVLYELTAIARERGALERAERRARQGLAAAEHLSDMATHYVHAFQVELGRVHTAAGRFEAAERVLLESRESFAGLERRPPGMPPPEAALGELYRAWGRPPPAADGGE